MATKQYRAIIKTVNYTEIKLDVDTEHEGEPVEKVILEYFDDCGDEYRPMATAPYEPTAEIVVLEVIDPEAMRQKKLQALNERLANAKAHIDEYKSYIESIERQIKRTESMKINNDSAPVQIISQLAGKSSHSTV